MTIELNTKYYVFKIDERDKYSLESHYDRYENILDEKQLKKTYCQICYSSSSSRCATHFQAQGTSQFSHPNFIGSIHTNDISII